jgi:hypothetical protein
LLLRQAVPLLLLVLQAPVVHLLEDLVAPGDGGEEFVA